MEILLRVAVIGIPLLWIGVGIWLWWDNRRIVRQLEAIQDPVERRRLLRAWRES